MPGAFDTVAERAGAAVIRHLSDCDLLIDGDPVRGLWRAPHVTALDMLDVAVPSVTIWAADAADVSRGSTVVRSSVSHVVIGVEPDGYGLVTLRLERA
jgi:hypothetical protein